MKKEKIQKIYRSIMLVVLTAAITFIFTSISMYRSLGQGKVKYVASDTIGRTFQTFHSFIERHYLGEMDDNAMLESAIKGYVEGLNDEYSEYITKEEMKEYMQDTTGKYVGIGIYTQTNQIVVLAPMKGSPAEEAGLKSGDVITKVDGVLYTGETLSEASNALKKEEGTKAQIEILRDGQVLNFEVERREVKMNHIEAEVLENKIGYMEISTFDEGCYQEFKQKWEELKAKNITSLIIDLRNNTGGYLSAAKEVASLFLEKGKVIYSLEEKEDTKTFKDESDEKRDYKIILLMNEGSASASEVLIAALQESYGAITVGTTTYGKGKVQQTHTLEDGSMVKYTSAKWLTPKGTCIDEIGITPDYVIENTSLDIDEQLNKAIELARE